MVQRAVHTAKAFKQATRLSTVGAIWLAVAAAVVGGCFLMLSKASEDVVRHNGLALNDPARLHWFVIHRPDAAVALARFVTTLGSPVTLIAVAFAAAVWLWRRGAHLVIAVAPILAITVAGGAATVTKASVGRPRPPVALHLVTETERSFPSGHTTDSTAVYLTLALVVAITILRSPKARAAVVAGAGALAGAIGLSRLTLGVHWPSDVIAGWALGTMVATVVSVAVVLVARTQPASPVEAHAARRRRLARLHGIALVERTKPLPFTA